MQAVAAFLFFAVFILLFIALTLYLGTIAYTYFKKYKADQANSDKPEKHA